MNGHRLLVSLGLVLATSPGFAQDQSPRPPREEHVAVATIPARTDDVSTLDGIVKAYYEVISGPAGRPREWARDRTLYLPTVRFVDIRETKDGGVEPRISSHQEYVDRTNAELIKQGFDERDPPRHGEIRLDREHLFDVRESTRSGRPRHRARRQQPPALPRWQALVDRRSDVAGRVAEEPDPDAIPSGSWTIKTSRQVA